MNRLVEDMLCGLLGYGIGSSIAQKRNEISQEEAESLIRSFLSHVPLNEVIDHWIEANDCTTLSKRLEIENILRDKAEQII